MGDRVAARQFLLLAVIAVAGWVARPLAYGTAGQTGLVGMTLAAGLIAAVAPLLFIRAVA